MTSNTIYMDSDHSDNENYEVDEIDEVEEVDEIKKTEKIKKEFGKKIDIEVSKKPLKYNFMCGSCSKPFHLDINQKIIGCIFCGYRILFKLRTPIYVTFKTE